MRVLIAGLLAETNVYSPFPTGRRSFETFEFRRGDATQYPPTLFSGPLHVWRREAENRGWSVVEGLLACAQPSGLVTRLAYESIRDEILSQVRAALPLDIVLLNLHGAMVSDGYDDCEGDLLGRVRALVGAVAVIGVELDLHCHLSASKLAHADVIVIYKEYPHTDPMDRALEVFKICADTALGKVRPVMACYDCRMQGSYRTPVEPMRSFVARMKAWEGRDGILSVSLAHGFSFADVESVGSRMLVVADADRDQAARLAEQLGQEFFSRRFELAGQFLNADEALDVVERAKEGPVVLADRADNPGSGAPGDSTFLLANVLQRKIRSALVGVMWDPVIVQLAHEAGLHAKLNVRLGGKSGPVSGVPMDLAVTVRGLAHNAHQPFGRALEPLGDMAWLSTGDVDIVVNTLRQQTFHPDAFRAVGIEPGGYRLIIVKSAQHFFDGFAPLAKQILYVTTPGAAQPNYLELPYTKRRTPFWPHVADPFIEG
jgi:microcystin degradation protein MlrC